VRHAQSFELQLAVIVYGMTLVMLFAVSGFYHTPNWPPDTRMKLRRLDRSMVYLFVAGGFTPYFMVIESEHSVWVLLTVWAGALLGTIKSCFFPHAPRALTAGLYVLLGLVAVPFMPAMLEQLGPTPVLLVAIGGVAYVSGALCYARKAPNPVPGWFGYHEVFHVCVIIGAALHYAGAWLIVG
jgi:hemolysin III